MIRFLYNGKCTKKILVMGLMAIVALSALFGCGKQEPGSITSIKPDTFDVANEDVISAVNAMNNLVDYLEPRFGYIDRSKVPNLGERMSSVMESVESLGSLENKADKSINAIKEYIRDENSNANNAKRALNELESGSYLNAAKFSLVKKSIEAADEANNALVKEYESLSQFYKEIDTGIVSTRELLANVESDLAIYQSSLDSLDRAYVQSKNKYYLGKDMLESYNEAHLNSESDRIDDFANSFLLYFYATAYGYDPDVFEIRDHTDVFIDGYEKDSEGNFVPITTEITRKHVFAWGICLSGDGYIVKVDNEGNVRLELSSIHSEQEEVILAEEVGEYFDNAGKELELTDNIIYVPTASDAPEKGIYAVDLNNAVVLQTTSQTFNKAVPINEKNRVNYTVTYSPREGEEETVRYVHDKKGLNEIHELACNARYQGTLCYSMRYDHFSTKSEAESFMKYNADLLTSGFWKISKKGTYKNSKKDYGFYIDYYSNIDFTSRETIPIRTITYKDTFYGYQVITEAVKGKIDHYTVEVAELNTLDTRKFIPELENNMDTIKKEYEDFDQVRTTLGDSIVKAKDSVKACKDKLDNIPKERANNNAALTGEALAAISLLMEVKDNYSLLSGDITTSTASITDITDYTNITDIPNSQVPLSDTLGGG